MTLDRGNLRKQVTFIQSAMDASALSPFQFYTFEKKQKQKKMNVKCDKLFMPIESAKRDKWAERYFTESESWLVCLRDLILCAFVCNVKNRYAI